MERPLSEFERLQHALMVETVEDTQDDFHTYVAAPAVKKIEGTTQLQWWCQSSQRALYPHLSRMAIAILSIPAESGEPVRISSGGRRTCSWDRLGSYLRGKPR